MIKTRPDIYKPVTKKHITSEYMMGYIDEEYIHYMGAYYFWRTNPLRIKAKKPKRQFVKLSIS